MIEVKRFGVENFQQARRHLLGSSICENGMLHYLTSQELLPCCKTLWHM